MKFPKLFVSGPYPALKEIRQNLADSIQRINQENGADKFYPFSLTSEGVRAYSEKFLQDKKWLNSASELFKTLGVENLSPQDVYYPWWNDITLAVSEDVNKSAVKTKLSHSYAAQLIKNGKIKEIKPLSIISITCAHDGYYVLGVKTGAYDKKMIFIPSGYITLDDAEDVSLPHLLSKQFTDELNLDLSQAKDVNYCGLVYDTQSSEDCLMIFKVNLSTDPQKVYKAWQQSKDRFELSDVIFMEKQELKTNVSKMLESAKCCLPYI